MFDLYFAISIMFDLYRIMLGSKPHLGVYRKRSVEGVWCAVCVNITFSLKKSFSSNKSFFSPHKSFFSRLKVILPQEVSFPA